MDLLGITFFTSFIYHNVTNQHCQHLYRARVARYWYADPDYRRTVKPRTWTAAVGRLHYRCSAFCSFLAGLFWSYELARFVTRCSKLTVETLMSTRHLPPGWLTKKKKFKLRALTKVIQKFFWNSGKPTPLSCMFERERLTPWLSMTDIIRQNKTDRKCAMEDISAFDNVDESIIYRDKLYLYVLGNLYGNRKFFFSSGPTIFYPISWIC